MSRGKSERKIEDNSSTNVTPTTSLYQAERVRCPNYALIIG